VSTITAGSLWLVNGSTYRVDTLDNGRAQYPITMVPVSRDEAWIENLEKFIAENRMNADTAAELRAKANWPMHVELRWFERPDVKQVQDDALSVESQQSLFS
jgi:hypothetical protein